MTRRAAVNRLLSKNLDTRNLIILLRRKWKQNRAPIWKRASEAVNAPRRSRITVNLSKIARNTKPEDVVLVPGKVLGSGAIQHKISVAALRFSPGALAKIEQAGGKCLTIQQLTEAFPTGSNVKILR